MQTFLQLAMMLCNLCNMCVASPHRSRRGGHTTMLLFRTRTSTTAKKYKRQSQNINPITILSSPRTRPQARTKATALAAWRSKPGEQQQPVRRWKSHTYRKQLQGTRKAAAVCSKQSWGDISCRPAELRQSLPVARADQARRRPNDGWIDLLCSLDANEASGAEAWMLDAS